MSIPGMPPASVGGAEVADASPEPWSIPGVPSDIPDIPDIPAMPTMPDELDLVAIITNPTTALATTRTTAAITIWLVPVLRVMEVSSQDRGAVLGHDEDPQAQVSVIRVDSAPRDSHRDSMKVP
jgi:hypothetical protein